MALAAIRSVFEDYDQWNESVEAEFFDGSRAGHPVYLDLENDVLARIAERVGVLSEAKQEFAKVIKPTLYMPHETDGHLPPATNAKPLPSTPYRFHAPDRLQSNSLNERVAYTTLGAPHECHR